MQTVKEIVADQPGPPKPVIDQPPAKAAPQPAEAPAPPPTQGLEQAAGGLIETGLRFLESLAGMADQPIEQSLSSLVTQDPHTGRKVLSIPLPQSFDQDRIARAIAGVLSAFGRPA
jgi:hypothetical protein